MYKIIFKNMPDQHVNLLTNALRLYVDIGIGNWTNIAATCASNVLDENGKPTIYHGLSYSKIALIESIREKIAPAFREPFSSPYMDGVNEAVQDAADIANNLNHCLGNEYKTYVTKMVDRVEVKITKAKKGSNVTIIGDRNHFLALTDALETYMRVSIGQWDHIISVFGQNKDRDGKEFYGYIFADRNDNVLLSAIRNICVPAFEAKGIYANGSFGIHSKELSDDVRIVYDYFKLLMSQYNKYFGIDNVYSGRPYLTQEEPVKVDLDISDETAR